MQRILEADPAGDSKDLCMYSALFIAALISLTLLSSKAVSEPRIALLIGNSDYQHVSSLLNPENDTSLIAGKLESAGFDVFLVNGADREEMSQAISEFGVALREAGREATGLFYYAGHGVQSDKVNYLIPTDARVTSVADLSLVAIDTNAIIGQMASAGNVMNIVILDACRNNPFVQARDISESGLAEIDAPTGTLLVYSTAPETVALDGIGMNSPFATAFSSKLLDPGLPIAQLLIEVRNDVLAITLNRQTTWDSGSPTISFSFVAASANTSNQPARDEEATALFVEAYSQGTLLAFENFVSEYPRSPLATAALAEMAALRAANDRAERDALGLNETDLSIAELAQQISLLPSIPHPEDSLQGLTGNVDAPAGRDTIQLISAQRKELQLRLTSLGLDTGGVDGTIGPRTRRALSGWQDANQINPSGFFSPEQVPLFVEQTTAEAILLLDASDDTAPDADNVEYPIYMVDLLIDYCSNARRSGDDYVYASNGNGYGFCMYGDVSISELSQLAVERCNQATPTWIANILECRVVSVNGQDAESEILASLRQDNREPVIVELTDLETGISENYTGFLENGRYLSFSTREIRFVLENGDVVCDGVVNEYDVGSTFHLLCGDRRLVLINSLLEASIDGLIALEGRIQPVGTFYARGVNTLVRIESNWPEGTVILPVPLGFD